MYVFDSIGIGGPNSVQGSVWRAVVCEPAFLSGEGHPHRPVVQSPAGEWTASSGLPR